MNHAISGYEPLPILNSVTGQAKLCDMSSTTYRIFLYNRCNSNKGDETMTSKEAVAERILELCKEKGLAVNALANLAGVTPSTVYSMLNQKSNNPGIVTIQKLCDGMGITLHDFFDSPLFDHIEPVA